jgi:hypothetical protein
MSEMNQPQANIVDGAVVVDEEAAKARTRDNLESALRSVDNLQELLTMMCTREKRVAFAANVGFERPGTISLYVTASDNLDEVTLAKALVLHLNELFEKAGRVQP